jgi:hypothetical protein
MKPQAAQAIRQSKNFLEAARLLGSQDLVNQSISMAVHSAIQAKDALCIEFSGRTQRPKSHNQALEELKSTGKVPKAQLDQFRDLLGAKNDSEYEAPNLSSQRAAVLLLQAERFYYFAVESLN